MNTIFLNGGFKIVRFKMADNIKITVGIRIKFRIKVVVGVKIMG